MKHSKLILYSLLYCFLFMPIFIKGTNAMSMSNACASINDVWLEHNCYVNGQKGMIIHTNFDVHILKGVKIAVVAFFFDSDEQPLKGYSNKYRTNDGKACCGEVVTLQYDDSDYNDFKLFMPFSEITHYVRGSSAELKVGVAIGVHGGDGLAKSGYYEFTFNK